MFKNVAKEFFFLVVITNSALSTQEHKVHNLILYPDKNSWCQLTPIQQIISTPGYESITIQNNICVGACFSYSIPKTEPADQGEILGPYCDSCQPSATKCYHVNLTSEKNISPKLFQKRVEIITACSCKTCTKDIPNTCSNTNETTIELPKDHFKNKDVEVLDTDDVPELLGFQENVQKYRQEHHDNFTSDDDDTLPKYELNSKLIKLLKDIQNEGDGSNLKYDKKELKELLKIIEGSEKKLSDTNLMEFVNFVNIQNSEDFEIDLTKLKHVLKTFETDQQNDIDSDFSQKSKIKNVESENDLKNTNELLGQHLSFWGRGDIQNAKIKSDVEEMSRKTAQTDFGVERKHGWGIHHSMHKNTNFYETIDTNNDQHNQRSTPEPPTTESAHYPKLIHDSEIVHHIPETVQRLEQNVYRIDENVQTSQVNVQHQSGNVHHNSENVHHNSENVHHDSENVHHNSENVHHGHHHKKHHHHHHLGEEHTVLEADGSHNVHQVHEHLASGPHGSLVLVPDTTASGVQSNPIKIERKLSLASQELTPNHQGMIMSYGSPSSEQIEVKTLNTDNVKTEVKTVLLN